MADAFFRRAPVQGKNGLVVYAPGGMVKLFPHKPKTARSFARGTAASWPRVVMPAASRTSVVFGPIPGQTETGSGARRPGNSQARMTQRPLGFAVSVAIFATSLLGPAPAVTVKTGFPEDLPPNLLSQNLGRFRGARQVQKTSSTE